MMVVETPDGSTPATALEQNKNILTVLKTFLNQQVVLKMGSANYLDTVNNIPGGLTSAHQLLLWLINKVDPIYAPTTGSGNTGTTVGMTGGTPQEVFAAPDYEFQPFGTTVPNPNPGACNTIISIGTSPYVSPGGTAAFYVENFFTEIDVDCSDQNIIIFAPIIKYWMKTAIDAGGGALTLETFIQKVKPSFYDNPYENLLPGIYGEMQKSIKKVDPVS